MKKQRDKIAMHSHVPKKAKWRKIRIATFKTK